MAGKRAATSLRYWLACTTTFPSASFFGGVSAASSAPAQQRPGHDVRALARLLQHWRVAGEYRKASRTNSWAKKSILQSRTALSSSGVCPVSAPAGLAVREAYVAFLRCHHPRALWGAPWRWTLTWELSLLPKAPLPPAQARKHHLSPHPTNIQLQRGPARPSRVPAPLPFHTLLLGSASPRDTSPHQVTPCRAAREEMGDPKHDMTWYRLDSSHSCKGQQLKCWACKHFGGIAVYTMWREQAPCRNINRPVTTVFTLHKKKNTLTYSGIPSTVLLRQPLAVKKPSESTRGLSWSGN